MEVEAPEIESIEQKKKGAFEQTAKLKQLRAYENNAKIHTKEQVSAIRDSIIQFGYNDYIEVDENNVVLCGHGRLQALYQIDPLGEKEIKVTVIPNLTEPEKRAYRIAHNKTSMMTDFDATILSSEFETLKGMEELTATGFKESEVNKINERIGSMTAEEDKFDQNTQPKIQIQEGDMFQLGQHRLICGDSTKEMTYNKLMGNDRARMIFTDPPYGVKYTGGSQESTKEWDMIKNDDLEDENLKEFLMDALSHIYKYTVDNPALYVFHASRFHTVNEEALKEVGFEVKQQLIWEKQLVLGRADYHWSHEPCLFAMKKGKRAEWFADRTQTTVEKLKEKDIINMTKEDLVKYILRIKDATTLWKIKKDSTNTYIHPTQKPIAIPFRAITNSSKINEVVLDCFTGSGSTLMACEQTNRKFRGIELDPKYVSLIIQRWEEYTKQKAVKIA